MNHFNFQIADCHTEAPKNFPIKGSYSTLLAALPPMGADFCWEEHLEDWGPEEWAKLYYLHIVCDYSLHTVSELFTTIEVRGVPVAVASFDFFHHHFMPQVPMHLRMFINFDEYEIDCIKNGYITSFTFDGQDFTAIGFS
ncbi:hypothetical protein LPB72_07240 [Hydrogenophaga crassostreae]|uniref:YubB ferredoxin-like domain-containing protein n=1 Tax=Hydrogenophaga crassostreae TaxID=1763535 RepID=A0A162W0K7_9BURK|nr:hypothetical protein [Hydrogenophaga crassostreae]AOW13160.1 hypothetical protein LPB072_10135 [Hydrogenophaga crassostreae]OAD42695.1 hypothetical protein LPB72_07240 [Hydrogenophaga crassostreae]